MSDGWYVSHEDRVAGPFTWERALEMAGEGWIGIGDLVRRPGSNEWVPVADVPAFAGASMPAASAPVEESPAPPATPRPAPSPVARRGRTLGIAAVLFFVIATVAVGAPLAFDTGSSSVASGGIIFSRIKDGGQHIYVMAADGSNPQPVTSSEFGDTHPSASPDGSRIVFVRENKGLMLLDAGGEKQLTADAAYQPSSPIWSPDGERVFYSRLESASEGASRYIYSMKADGTDDRQVSPAFPGGSGSDEDPSISPDGTTLAFVTTRPPEASATGWAIVEMPVDGGALTYVTGAAEKGSSGIGGPWHPTWSPEGRIAFTAEPVGADGGERDQIYVMNADGSGKTQVTSENDGGCQDPVWSPDGTLIVFARSSSGQGLSIWAIDAAGGNDRALTEVNATDGDFSPSFLPETGALIAGSGGSGGGGSSGLAGRIGRIPAWWGERPAAVWSWVRIVLTGDGPSPGTEEAATGDDNPLLGAVKSLIEWVSDPWGGTRTVDLVGTWTGEAWGWAGPSSYETPDQRRACTSWSQNDIELVIERVEGDKAYGRIRRFNARGESDNPGFTPGDPTDIGPPPSRDGVATPDGLFQACTWLVTGNRIKLVEISPDGQGTGAGMFDAGIDPNSGPFVPPVDFVFVVDGDTMVRTLTYVDPGHGPSNGEMKLTRQR
ncbi:MAG: GYF domain-containing protein [Actinomycetota bacterium]|nr:GYF domain-containing protein [Actinomycetota bacterium]